MGATSFYAYLDLYGPDGALLGSGGGGDYQLAIDATNGGSFTALVTSYYTGDFGPYELSLALFGQPFSATSGTLVNGGANNGNLGFAALDTWTFTAKAGDNIVLRLGAPNFRAYLNLYGPDGSPQGYSYQIGEDVQMTYTATNSGTFTALVGGYDGGDSGPYALHLALFGEPFSVPGTPLSNGGQNSGNLGFAALDRWTFTAKTGDNIALRLGAAGFNANLNLYGPDGSLLAYPYGVAEDVQLSYTATNSGTFTALVTGYDQGDTGPYELSMALLGEPFSVPGVSLSNGGETNANLGLAALDNWTFTAKPGDTIVLRLGATNFIGSLNLYGPDGSPLGSRSGNDAQVTFTATNGGTFTAVVSGYEAGDSGPYRLSLALFGEPFNIPGIPLANGGQTNGNLGFAALDTWAFTAKPGDNIVLRLGTTNIDPYLELYGPDGSLLANGGGQDVQLTFTATNSGTFTALVFGNEAGDSGPYELSLALFGEPFNTPGVPLANGGETNGNLGFAALDLWTFTAKPGDNIVLRLGAANFNPYLRLYGPDGSLLNNGGGQDVQLTMTATNSGIFTALVFGNEAGDSGPYGLSLALFGEPFSVPGVPLANGGVNNGNLGPAALDRWSFTAKAGDSIVLQLGATNSNASLYLFGPDGSLLGSQGGADVRLTFTATNSGTFTVLVDGANSGDIGPYELSMALLGEPFSVPGVALVNGGENNGNLGPAALDRWTFTAKAGDNIVLRLGGTNFNPFLQLYGPDGSPLGYGGGQDFQLTFTATNSGVFTALVGGGNSGDSGPYELSLALFGEPFGVPAVPLVNGGQNNGALGLAALDRWTFTANAGDNMALRLGSTNFNAYLNLYGPDGSLLQYGGGQDIQLFYTATNSGSFTALVAGANAGEAGPYGLRLAHMPGVFVVPPAGEGGSLTGATNYNGVLKFAGLDIWTFTACEGDGINLQLNPTNFTVQLNLYGPDGALLQSTAYFEPVNINFTATNCGAFTVLVSSVEPGTGGSYSLSADRLSDGLKICPPVVTNTTLSVTGIGGLANAGATFVLSAAASVPAAAGLWTPVYTNQFDQTGLFTYTNASYPALPQQYFRFSAPPYNP
jgi:hypothetical protein